MDKSIIRRVTETIYTDYLQLLRCDFAAMFPFVCFQRSALDSFVFCVLGHFSLDRFYSHTYDQ
jgi:hypothetical protein